MMPEAAIGDLHRIKGEKQVPGGVRVKMTSTRLSVRVTLSLVVDGVRTGYCPSQ